MGRGLIIAATASGSGKTVLTLGLLRHLVRSGQRVASAKVGPDYIDAAFHAAATGRPCLNLDPWAMRPSTLAATIGQLGDDADLVVCEGVMGLFDGSVDCSGSTADVAALTGWPVVLVVDVRGQAASAAAVVKGFVEFRSDLRFLGVVFNRVGGPRHAALLADACAMAVPDVAVLGFIGRDHRLALPDRHLGLVQAVEHDDLDRLLNDAADAVADRLQTEALVDGARRARVSLPGSTHAALPPLGGRIAVASDKAFAFAYPAVLDGWRAAGAEVLPFSPLADEAPDDTADAVYLPGGYPELHAGRLAANARFLAGLQAAASRDAVVFGECGGYMVLGTALTDADGRPHAMAGLLPVETSFADRRLHLGYRQVQILETCPLGQAGAAFRGHEFHYARILREDASAPLFSCRDAAGEVLPAAGCVRGRVMGSFVHLIDRAEALAG